MAPPIVDMTSAALALHHAGLSVIPAAIDGTKAPLGQWRRYMAERMPEPQLRGWTEHGHQGIGVVTGQISGNLEMLELEGRAVGLLPEIVALAAAAGIEPLVHRLLGGYLERSPSGGVHLLYRVDGVPVPGNTKLAKRPATDAELAANPAEKIKTLIETRGEGGFVVVAPSHGTTHESGRPWELLAGGPHSIPTITAEERDALHTLCKTFNETPPPAAAPRFTQPSDNGRPEGGLSPGDDYETRTDWADILQPAGWTYVHGRGGLRYWRRPGKRLGISATTGAADDRERLYVFTTSTEFDAEVPYTKFGAYALLTHGGDHQAAARALAGAGYGRPAPEPARPAAVLRFAQPSEGTASPIPPGPNGVPDEAPPPLQPGATEVDEPETYSPTDDGNALRLVDAHLADVRYCPQRSSWLTWDGSRWRWDQGGLVIEHARQVSRGLPTLDHPQKQHRARSLSTRNVLAMVKLASSDQRIVAEIGSLDQHAEQLNTPAGAVNLRTGQLHPPDPAALHTRSTTVAPDMDAVPEQWLKFLADTFAGDPELTTYIQRLLGVSLVGQVLEQVLPFAHGEGANGKTTLLGVVMRLIGIGDDGYALTAPAELLLATRQAGHPTEVARLAGARLIVTSELDEGQRFAEAKVKQLTGRDPLAGRFMGRDFFSFTPTHSLWLLANHEPAVKTGGPAFWRRLRLLPFVHVVPPEQRDPHLEDKLVNEEGPAILGWLIRGAVDYFAHGLAEPDSVRAATSDYEASQDTVARFVEEMCVTGSPAQQLMAVHVSKFRTVYERWCDQEGDKPVSPKALTQALQRRYGIVSERSRTARYYRGIRLNEVTSELSHDDPDESPDEPEESGSGWEQQGW